MRRRAAALIAGGALLAAPASAQDSEPTRVVPKPKSGGTLTTFVVRYDSLGDEAAGGDTLYVTGPRGTRCAGEVLGNAVGHDGGITTIRMGPRLPADDIDGNRYDFVPRDPDTQKRLPRWCRGVYRGWINLEEESDPPVKHTRFRFAVR